MMLCPKIFRVYSEMRRHDWPEQSINHQSDIYNYVGLAKHFYHDTHARNLYHSNSKYHSAVQ